MQPEPIFRIGANIRFDELCQFLRHLSDIFFLISCLLHKKRAENLQVLIPVFPAMQEGCENRHIGKACHRGCAWNAVCLPAKEIENDAVMAVRILIHDKSDRITALKHAEHLTDALLVSDMHADLRAVLVDESVGRALLLHGDADHRDARHGKGSSHKRQ